MPTKKEREKQHRNQVYAKFNGRCAFCGYPLEIGWHIWKATSTKLFVIDRDGKSKDAATKQQDLPACISCNTTRLNNSRYALNKELIDIEEFREALYREFEFLATSSMASTYYKKALRYGLIQETNNPIVFYFEKAII